MISLEFILSSSISAAIAYLGNKQNNDANKIKKLSSEIVEFCNAYYSKVDFCINQRKNEIEKMLNNIGVLKKDFIDDALNEYLNFLDLNFTNFNIIHDIDSEFDEFIKINELFDTRILSTQMKNINLKYINPCFITLASFGISITSNHIINNLLVNNVNFIDSFLLSIGISIGINGVINKIEANKNYKTAMEYYEKTKKFSEEIIKIIETYDSMLYKITEIANTLRLTVVNFAIAFANFANDIYEIKDNLYYSNNERINTKELSMDTKIKLKNMYIMAQIVYHSFDLPIFTVNGSFNNKSLNEIISNYNNTLEIIGSI